MATNNFTIFDYHSMYKEMRIDAGILLKKAEEIKCYAAIKAFKEAIKLLNETKKLTDTTETEMYYNEIQAELISGQEYLNTFENQKGICNV